MGDRSAHIPDMICIQPQRWKTRVDFINSKQTKKNMVSKASAMAPSIKNVANWRQVSKNWNWSSTGIWRVIVFWEGRLEVSEIYMYESYISFLVHNSSAYLPETRMWALRRCSPIVDGSCRRSRPAGTAARGPGDRLHRCPDHRSTLE